MDHHHPVEDRSCKDSPMECTLPLHFLLEKIALNQRHCFLNSNFTYFTKKNCMFNIEYNYTPNFEISVCTNKVYKSKFNYKILALHHVSHISTLNKLTKYISTVQATTHYSMFSEESIDYRITSAYGQHNLPRHQPSKH